jgi:hypothetical protein
MLGLTAVCANALIRLGYGVPALANPSRPLFGKIALAPDTDDLPPARLFVRGFASHQIGVALVGLLSLGRPELRRPAMALAAAIDLADVASAAVEAEARSGLDSDLLRGMVFSSAGLVSALVGLAAAPAR